MAFFQELVFQDLLISTLILEFFAFISLTLVIIARRIWATYKNKQEDNHRQGISTIIMNCLKQPQNLESNLLKFKSFDRQTLLSVLESFDRRFSDEKWQSVKGQISQNYLRPQARKWKNHRNWFKRNFSARCFALSPSLQDKREILSLMDDPIFLVRSIASIGAVKLEIKEAVIKMIAYMKQDSGYARYFYRDILLYGKSKQIFMWIEEIAAKTQDPQIHLICLDLLAQKSQPLTASFLKEDLQSNDSNIRLAALKVFALNPQKDSLQVLLQFLENPDDRVRAEAIKGMAHFATKENLEKIEKALIDPSWLVRFEAAKALKNAGRKGGEILSQQSPQKNKKAYEAAQYALQFDW